MNDLGRQSTKTASTFYTPEKVAAARRNIADYDRARAVRDKALAAANPYLAKGDEWLWALATTQKLPRSYAVNQALGSPITGRGIYQYGNYPWLADPLTRPWKIVDPSSDYVFPTNDFAAFYASGVDATGQFDPTRADRSLLLNQLYPERGPTWGVDDGYGWIDAAGKKWTFVAYYNHWHNWFGDVATTTAKGAIHNTIRSLRDAFVFTGDLKFAHAGLIMLDRVADVYPAMDTFVYKAAQGFLNSGPGNRGRIIGSQWETFLVRDLISAYDAFFPAVATSDAANIVPFLKAKAEAYGLPPKASIEAIKQNIEDKVIRSIFPNVEKYRVAGNFGSHQSSLAMAAVVLDSPTESNAWIDWIFKSGGLVSTPDLHLTGGNMYATLIGDVDRDGFGNEAAPGYNFGWITTIGLTADILAGYSRYPTADLYKHLKYAKMIEGRVVLTMLNKYWPPIGDSGSTGRPILTGGAQPQQLTADFERYGRPFYAQMAYLLNNNSLTDLYGSIFSTDVEGTRRRIQEIVEASLLNLPSVNLTGYGFAALRAGTGPTMRGLWSYYGRTIWHGHADALNLGMYGFGVDLLPELGYPEFADNNARRHEWNGNTIAHNTVTVDAKRQLTHWVGQPHGFATTDRVQLFDISAPKVYPQTSRYRRVTAMIAVGPNEWYAVDVFRITGGSDHHLSFHAAEGPVTTTGLELTEQPTGTYAGPDIYPPPDNAVPRPGPSGFDWLFNVSRANPTSPFSVDWKIKDTWNVLDPDPDLHVRLTVLSDVDDVALCDGIPPRNKPGNPASLRYVIAHRHGLELASQFVSVIEPYVGQAKIRAATAVSVVPIDDEEVGAHDTTAVKIELTNGRVDYLVSSLRVDQQFEVDGKFVFQGGFGVYSYQGDRPVYAMSHDAALLGDPGVRRGVPAVLGKVAAFTETLSATNTITLTLDSPLTDPAALVGHYLYVDNDGERNAVYRIAGITPASGTNYVFDIGDTTTIRGYVNPGDFNLGYLYDVAIGAGARIPITREWTP